MDWAVTMPMALAVMMLPTNTYTVTNNRVSSEVCPRARHTTSKREDNHM